MADIMSIAKIGEILGSWDQAICDGKERLRRVEAKARRLREAIQTFEDSKANGELWMGTVDQTENAATQN